MVTTKSVSYCTEIDALLNLMVTLAKDIKAKKSVNEEISDLAGPFFAALQKLGDLSVEVMDRKALETTIALKVSELTEVFLS